MPLAPRVVAIARDPIERIFDWRGGSALGDVDCGECLIQFFFGLSDELVSHRTS